MTIYTEIIAKLYCVLSSLAKSDLKAANILTQKNLYSQAIYFFSQSFEKSLKSVIAFYQITYKDQDESDTANELIHRHGHRLRELTQEILKIFVDRDKRLYLQRGGKENDPFIQSSYKAIDLEGQRYELSEHVALFDENVRYHYEIYYKSLDWGQPLTLLDPRWGVLREKAKIPYLKYSMLARILFSLLNGMDTASRYPIVKMKNMNIARLNRIENKIPCISLGKMIEELIVLEPLVLKEIESLDKN